VEAWSIEVHRSTDPAKSSLGKKSMIRLKKMDSSKLRQASKWYKRFLVIGMNTISISLMHRSPDIWGLGCLIWESFNGPLRSPTSLKTIGNVNTSNLVAILN